MTNLAFQLHIDGLIATQLTGIGLLEGHPEPDDGVRADLSKDLADKLQQPAESQSLLARSTRLAEEVGALELLMTVDSVGSA